MKNVSSPEWLTCATTKARVSSLGAVLEEIIKPGDRHVGPLVSRLVEMGGKRIRPSLFFLAASFGDKYEKEFLFPAAALELIHVASLYHDDVMDKAERRRNVPSVNSEWGNNNATYAGSFLFSEAIAILAGCGAAINRITCRYVNELCLGQLHEVENAYNVSMPVTMHLGVLSKKTASLFELPCILGAMLSQASAADVKALRTYGKNLGIAFQLKDDLLDLTGDPARTGKNPGTDLREGVYSYATIHALRSKRHAESLAPLLQIEEPTTDDIAECIDIIEDSGGMNAASEKIDDYADKAREAIAPLPRTAAHDSLNSLIQFITSRDH